MPEREPWPADVRARALVLAVDSTAEAASIETGIEAATIRQWLKRSLDAVRPHLPPELQSVTSWHDARALLVDAVAVVATNALIAIDKAIEEGRARDAQHYGVTFGILCDKGLLFAGEANSRTDARVLRADVDGAGRRAEEIARLRAEVDELRSRRELQP